MAEDGLYCQRIDSIFPPLPQKNGRNNKQTREKEFYNQLIFHPKSHYLPYPPYQTKRKRNHNPSIDYHMYYNYLDFNRFLTCICRHPYCIIENYFSSIEKLPRRKALGPIFQ